MLRQSGAVRGFALARRGMNFQQIGPIEGESPEICAALLAHTLSKMNGARVIADVLTTNPWAKAIAESHGLKHQRPFLRMAFGQNSSPGQREKILAICCPELG